MNEVWNLDPIYKGFDDPTFEAELEELKNLVGAYAAFAAALAETDPAEGLCKGIAMQEKITHLVGTKEILKKDFDAARYLASQKEPLAAFGAARKKHLLY